MPHADREARLAYLRDYRAKNPDKRSRTAYQAARREEARQIIRAHKDKPCADCGQSYPHYVMQYDHVRGVKLFDLSTAIRSNRSRDRILEEIAKCDVVCANCHAERTHG